MQTESHIHQHPEFMDNLDSGRIQMGNGRKTHVFGHLLEAGDKLEPDDVYASSNGYFEKCPCPGLKLENVSDRDGRAVVWVRPA